MFVHESVAGAMSEGASRGEGDPGWPTVSPGRSTWTHTATTGNFPCPLGHSAGARPPRKSRQKVGRGDKRTAKGKRFRGSHGNTRPKRPSRKKMPAVRKVPTKK